METNNLPAKRVELPKLPIEKDDYGMNFITGYYIVFVDSIKVNQNPYYWCEKSFNTKEEANRYRNKFYKRIKRKGYTVTCDYNKKDNCDFFIQLIKIICEVDPMYDNYAPTKIVIDKQRVKSYDKIINP